MYLCNNFIPPFAEENTLHFKSLLHNYNKTTQNGFALYKYETNKHYLQKKAHCV